MTKQCVRSRETCLITPLIAASLANLPMLKSFSAHVQTLHKGTLWLAHSRGPGQVFPRVAAPAPDAPTDLCCQCSNTRRRAAAGESSLPVCLFCTFFLSFRDISLWFHYYGQNTINATACGPGGHSGTKVWTGAIWERAVWVGAIRLRQP